MNVIPKNYDTSSFDGKSKTVVLPAGVPSLPRKQEETPTEPALPKPEPSAAQRALIELRSLHGHRHALKLYDLKRVATGGDSNVTDGNKHSTRGRRTYKPGSNPSLMKEITNSRNLYHNDTVKHLMHQLSELNNITYGRIEKGNLENESFCSEMTLQTRSENNLSEKESLTQQSMTNSKSRGGAGSQKSHNVMKLIERQILRDLTHHISRSATKPYKNKQTDGQPNTKTHSDELPGEMKVVIKKTTRSNDQKVTRKQEITLPSLTKSDPQDSHKRKTEKFEWSLDMSRVTNKPLPELSGVSIRGRTAPEVLEATNSAPTGTPSRRKKAHNTQYGDRTQSSLPKIQEEPDVQLKDRDEDPPTTRDVGTNCSPPVGKEPTPTYESPDNKVKLPILGKSIGQHRELNYEGGSKFSKPSLHEIKRIIHGLYGDYFDSTLERYYTYEKQLNETRGPTNEADVHYLTPAWDDSNEPAASHTLQLFKSASKRSEDAQYKHLNQTMSVPIIRSKYGKAIASSNKVVHKQLERRNRMVQASERVSYSQPVISSEASRHREVESGAYTAFVKDRLTQHSVTPNTPNEKVLRNYIAHQVALYHEQVARENQSLNENFDAHNKNDNDARYVTEDRKTSSLTQFTEDIDRYAQYLEAYLEAKRKHSQERKAKLQELKERQREKKYQKNKHLEVVEQRDAFLAQVALENLPRVPKPSANADRESLNNVSFSYAHEDHRYNQTPVVEMNSGINNEKILDAKGDKQAMGTKIYRIFGERKNSASTIHRWVAQAPVPYTSRAIRRQVPRSSKDATKSLNLPQHVPRHMRQRNPRPKLMTDLVSRFQVATRYKLDRDYVASLASGTT
uniref:uncharacterized protein LOC120334082 n=1 Tax=Styela clava TaxID=7725 RepID=UPI00193969F4|nr:uncharacterized protein LOC120334082 [Styela clava]